MKYQPITGVWEITMGCNMKCKHCGSGCAEPLADELTTEEALALARDIAQLGLQWITLSGGEPFTRPDWPLLVREFSQHGVIPNMISNGWLITDEILDTAKANDVGAIAISLDGLEETHDFMRKPGSFERAVRSLNMMKAKNMKAGVVTTVSKKNIHELHGIKDLLTQIGASYWQLQIGLPMGNFHFRRDMILEPRQVDEVIDFTYETMKEGQIVVYPADCLGYYNIRELEVRKQAHRSETYPIWNGCNAGKRSLGILHNGDILGCTSIRDRQYVEGNIRQRSIRDIWEDDAAFTWSRNATKSDLHGNCKVCTYGDMCLGGCPNTRLTMNGTIESENAYCSYNVAMRDTEAKVAAIDDLAELTRLGKKHAQQGDYQLAAMLLQKALAQAPNDIELLNYEGFVHFFLNNFSECREANRKVLALDPDNVYATKGMGLALYRSGEVEAGISYLKKAVALTDVTYLDPYYDLVVVYLECGRTREAKELQEKALELVRATRRASGSEGSEKRI
ncbi:MAG: radical SAM protein [Candidatus Omnitrophota bacterium]